MSIISNSFKKTITNIADDDFSSLNEYKEYQKFLPMQDNMLPALIKYGVVDYGAVWEGEKQENRSKLIQKISDCYDKDNIFLAEAVTNDYYFTILLLAIENPRVDILYKIIDGIYADMKPDILRDMFYILSRIVSSPIYICVLCEFYISHIDKEWDVDTYSLNAIFNLIMSKESIEKLFWNGFFYPSDGCILSPEQRDISHRMIVAITELNAKVWLLAASYGEPTADIFDVDEYLSVENTVSK